MKFTRSFSASVGQYSTGTAGPDQMEYDLDQIAKNLDPTQSGGGIGAENMQSNAATDTIIGNRTVDQAIATAAANTGTLTQLLSWIVKNILAMKGSVTNWYDSAGTTLAAAKTHIDAIAPHSGHETPSGAQTKVNAHGNLTTGTHNIAGTIVGTTDTQTISNKTLGGNLAAGGYKVTGLGTPTANTDSATKGYADGQDALYHSQTTAAVSEAINDVVLVLKDGLMPPGCTDLLYASNGELVCASVGIVGI